MMRSIWSPTLITALILIEPSFAQKIVDPNAVAPEYREAAEKRRAEQIKQRECAHGQSENNPKRPDRLSH